jgi:hypothetical protein
MSTAAAIGVSALGSYFGGKSARSKANDAARQEAAMLREIHDQAYAAYGPEAAEKAVQDAIEEISRRSAAAQRGAENDLYARGMGERSSGATAGIQAEAMKNKLEARQNVETNYPKYLLDALSGLQGGYANQTAQTAANAGAATALPLDVLNLYMNMKGMGGAGGAAAPAVKTLPVPGSSGVPGNFATGWQGMADSLNKTKRAR